jgi:hypothetical protein
MLNKITRTLGLAALIAAAAPVAQAGVMTFGSLVDNNNYTEAGLSMTASTVWNWPGAGMAHMDDGVAIFKLTSGADFNLDSVDMIASGGTGPARFSAYFDGVLQGSVDVGGGDGHYNFDASLFDAIDEFRVSRVDGHFTFDNLTFSDAAGSVPEPMSLALVGVALAGIGAARRRKA